MATRMDRRAITIEITGNTTAKNEITANNIEIIVTAGVVTITGIMTTNTEMAAETEVTTEGPPQIIMNPIITGI